MSGEARIAIVSGATGAGSRTVSLPCCRLTLSSSCRCTWWPPATGLALWMGASFGAHQDQCRPALRVSYLQKLSSAESYGPVTRISNRARGKSYLDGIILVDGSAIEFQSGLR